MVLPDHASISLTSQPPKVMHFLQVSMMDHTSSEGKGSKTIMMYGHYMSNAEFGFEMPRFLSLITFFLHQNFFFNIFIGELPKVDLF